MKKYTQARGTNLNDPFVVLLAKLTGLSKPKKARQAYQHWSKFHYEEKIKPTVVKNWEAHKKEKGLPASKGLNTGFRGQVTLRMFNKLPLEERVQWAKDAKVFSKLENQEYDEALKRPYAQDPASRQR